MVDQVQCPNCGGYKVQASEAFILATNGKPLDRGAYFRYAWIWVVFGWIPVLISHVFLGALLNWILGNDVLAVVSGFVTYVGVVVWLIVVGIQQNRSSRLIGNNNECNLCGYKWYWKLGDRLPQVTANPALMALGEHKNRENAAQVEASRRAAQADDERRHRLQE